MLGEAALTARDAERYQQAYREGFKAIGARREEHDIFAAPSLSVKLSALHPRYEFEQRDRVLAELVPKVLELAQLARSLDIALTLDAEEADRLGLSLDVFEAVLTALNSMAGTASGWPSRPTSKRPCRQSETLARLARDSGHRIPVRLVKGAYWDAEIKHAQVEGFDGYPVFTRKANTDVSYIAGKPACAGTARGLLSAICHA